ALPHTSPCPPAGVRSSRRSGGRCLPPHGGQSPSDRSPPVPGPPYRWWG
ncbi:hypothetical protein PBMFNG_PBMFNG_08510, partial [Dysosmobacter welbionis]